MLCIKNVQLNFAVGTQLTNFPANNLGIPGSARLKGVRVGDITTTVCPDGTAMMAAAQFNKSYLTVQQASTKVVDTLSLNDLKALSTNNQENLGYYPLDMMAADLDVSGSYVYIVGTSTAVQAVLIEFLFEI